MRIKKGDLVKVISGGKGLKGLQGKVLLVNRETEKITIEGGPVRKKHLKPEKSRKHPEGGIIELPVFIHASNVMLVSQELGRPVRVSKRKDIVEKIL
jgi:large subunit ribosomal protein L24